jgi:hypothetical protein
MPDQTEILLQEVAILRQEIALLHTMLETSCESLQNLNVAFLKRLDVLTVMVRDIQTRLPPLPQ